MNRESLIGRLLWLREIRLRNEVAQLRARAAALAELERTRDGACAAAVIEAGVELRDLAVIGEVRLNSGRAVREISAQVEVASNQVDRARRQAEAMRDAQADLRQTKRLRRERTADADTDQFETWKRGARPLR